MSVCPPVHRDVKPSNVLLKAAPDGSLRVKVGDFDHSKELAEGRQSASVSTGGGGTRWVTVVVYSFQSFTWIYLGVSSFLRRLTSNDTPRVRIAAFTVQAPILQCSTSNLMIILLNLIYKRKLIEKCNLNYIVIQPFVALML